MLAPLLNMPQIFLKTTKRQKRTKGLIKKLITCVSSDTTCGSGIKNIPVICSATRYGVEAVAY